VANERERRVRQEGVIRVPQQQHDALEHTRVLAVVRLYQYRSILLLCTFIGKPMRLEILITEDTGRGHAWNKLLQLWLPEMYLTTSVKVI